MSAFELLKEDPHTRARRGRLQCLHGTIETPIFMPVGTQGTVKALTPAQLEEVGAQIILGNTYHLNLRPGSELVQEMGGLHRFMGWNRPILTDSGGFQVFSLASLRQISERGIAFKSHLDGSNVFLGPQEVVTIQDQLGSDIAMVLDECAPAGCSEAEAQTAVDRSLRWAEDCVKVAATRGFLERGHYLFPIVQGNRFPAMRRQCAEALVQLDMAGYAIGGVSVGEAEADMMIAVEASTEVLPKHKPRYVMGVGTPPQLLRFIALGADMFDCVMPTREARHGIAFTSRGKINLKNNRFRTDSAPLEEGMDNYTCRHFSRAYLRHLLVSGEMLAATLLSLHNVHFFLDLMRQARAHLEAGDFHAWSQAWIERYERGQEG
ncbi:MAG: tRNA guanosine(34) transglycosylase Tgt [Verrucomicrobiota bacterium JB022]|nr:tRNA guanosine(34) transglycosylase Tgt [Verrucomicrobiota bacterium JB022]